MSPIALKHVLGYLRYLKKCTTILLEKILFYAVYKGRNTSFRNNPGSKNIDLNELSQIYSQTIINLLMKMLEEPCESRTLKTDLELKMYSKKSEL
jgi:hypothetical protein